MKKHRFIQCALALACFGTVLLPAEAQVILNPNTIRGTIRFSNANPDVLALLNAPGEEGMKFAAVGASSLPPAPTISASTASSPADARTSTSYEITVDSDAAGIAYGVTPSINMLDGAEAYYFATRNSAPVVAGGPPVTLDFEECVGVVTVRFVDAAGAPVAVEGGQIIASGYQFHRSSITAGSTEARIYVLGGQTHPLIITVNRGTDFYVDRLTFSLSTEVKVGCDEFATVDMVLPDTGDLGRITGQVDMLGEFELTIDGRDDLNYPDTTGVIANFGPFQNQRWAALKGTHFTVPSSGAYVLPNVAATTLDPASPGYAVYAQMYFRTGRQVQSFRSPALGQGANAALKVEPGEGVDLGDLFVINPGYLRGKVLLQGPPESPDHKSLLRGLQHAGDSDDDHDGVPDFLGTYGVYWSSVGVEGVDRLAAGASLTASFGYGNADFAGDFNAASSAYEGQYEMALGGLKSERSLWKPTYLSLALVSPAGAPESDYYYNSLSVADRRENVKEIVPGEAAAHDVAYCFSEVRVVFRSTGGKFYNPQVRFSTGTFTGTDFQGQPADYSAYLDIAAGTPTAQADAANVGVVVMYLPQGTYRLSPSVTPAESTFALTGLEPIDLTVGCGQRIEIEQCLRVELAAPACVNTGSVTLNGSVRTCANQVTRISYRLNDGEESTICENCGENPNFSFAVDLPAGDNTLEVIARDAGGASSSVRTKLTADSTPPVIQCPADLTVTAADAAGAKVDYTVTATDDRPGDVRLECVPASGSVFQVGTTVVTCTATDLCGNTKTCTFQVIVNPPVQDCVRVVIEPPVCTPNFGFLARANATSCGVTLTNLSLRASPVSNPALRLAYSDIRILIGARTELTTANGLFPEFDGFDPAIYREDILYTATVIDNEGRVATATLVTRYDVDPPVLQCPADLVTARTSPCGAFVLYDVTATDNCARQVTVVCQPPSGSVFPIGESVVQCTATDFVGNSSQCSFKVTVAAGAEFPAPTVSGVTPGLIAVTGGTQLTVTGANFTPDDEVLLDGQPLLFQVFVSDSELTGQAPALAAGSHELQIRRCGEIVARLENACESGGLPRIFFVEPRQAFARGGNSVVVRGANFTADTKIRIAFPVADGTANLLRNATVSDDGTTITGEVPPLSADELLGPRDVIAEEPRGQDVLPGGLCYFPNPTETDPQVVSLRELQAASTIPVDAEWRNGFPSGLLARVQVPGATPEERARAFVRQFDDLLQVQNPDAELAVSRMESEGLDDVKLAQSYRGVPIFGAEIVVTLAADEVVALTGNLLPLAELDARGFDVTPALTPEQAVDAARVDQNIQQPTDQLVPATELMIYDQCLFTTAPLDPHLVWKVKMNFSEFETLVDARTGEIVARLPLYRSHGFDLDIQDAEREANAQSDSCFNLSDDTDVADEDDFNGDYNNDLDAVLANRFARDCWFYFHNVFGWHSYDNDEGQLEVFIHTTMNPAGVAQWAQGCDLMQFTDGAVDYEILVHEFTHGVVASTSRLAYQFQSGALDESYADTMAVIADRERGEQENPGAPVNWTIGENLRMAQTRPNGTLLVTPPIRSFNNPPSINGDPDRMANLCCTGVGTPNQGNDWGGVHSNSGIPNKAGYLMIEGASFQGFLVRGMGADKTRHVKFWALRNLPSNASFADARAREIVAAESFASRQERGFTRDDVCTVRNAWAAVGVGLGDSDCDGIEDTRNDTDGDLIPNKIDNCPFFANPGQQDPDGDKRGGVQTVDAAGNIINVGCDNCPNTFNPGQEDYDSDNIGDVCDPDRDGDGCRNEVDQNPDSNQHRIGTSFSPTCPDKSSVLYGFAGGNSDCRGFGCRDPRDCEDLDDDNDGIPDDQDPCPVGKLQNTIGGECSVVGADCPRLRNDWWRTCLGGGCVQFYARVIDRINPNPLRDLIVDRVNIVNQTVYLQPNIGVSLAATAKRIAGVRGVGLQADQPQLLRIEIWRRATDTEPARLETVVGDFDPTKVKLDQLELGSLLAFTPGVATEPPTLGAVWHVGDFPVNASLDTDGDGLPDGWEIAHGLNQDNPDDAALDDDGDGVSNADEFRTGTDPAAPTSRLEIRFGERDGGRFLVHISGPVGRRCQLERRSELGNGSWSSVGAPIRLQGETATLADDSGATLNQAFYRISLLPD